MYVYEDAVCMYIGGHVSGYSLMGTWLKLARSRCSPVWITCLLCDLGQVIQPLRKCMVAKRKIENKGEYGSLYIFISDSIMDPVRYQVHVRARTQTLVFLSRHIHLQCECDLYGQ